MPVKNGSARKKNDEGSKKQKMSKKQELHNLLNNLPPTFTIKKVAKICNVGYSSLSNHKSSIVSRWMSEQRAELVYKTLNDYLGNPTNSLEVKVNTSGEVLAVKSGSVSRVVDDLLNLYEKLNEEAEEKRKKAEEVLLAIDLLRRVF